MKTNEESSYLTPGSEDEMAYGVSLFKTPMRNGVWWHGPVTVALGRMKQNVLSFKPA